MRLLITGCGAHSKSLVRSLKNNYEERDVFVIGINNNEKNILRTEVDEYCICPGIYADNYISWLTEYCIAMDVDIILPYITAELPILSYYKNTVEKCGVKVSVSNPQSLNVANDKIAMAKRYGKLMPKQTVVEKPEEVYEFAKSVGYFKGDHDVCAKINSSCGGTGFVILDERKWLDITSFNKRGVPRYMSIDQLCEIAAKVDTKIILQEYVPGTDYSVCVLAKDGEVQTMCGIAGYSMEYGAVMTGEIIKNEKAYQLSEEIVKDLYLDGNVCFDFIVKDDGTPVLLECNPRINASIPFIAEAGIDLVYLRCKQLLGEDIPKDIDYNYGLKMVKYYESHFYK